MNSSNITNNFFVPHFHNPGFLAGKISDDLLQKVKKLVNDPISKKATNLKTHLVGVITEQLVTKEIPELKKYIDDLYNHWVRVYNLEMVPYKHGEMWTNYMRKGEFNPNHNHSPAIAAYVLWVTIPYSLENEGNVAGYINHVPPRTSCFEFTYSTYEGKILNVPVFVDKSMEGTITMFPGGLTHCVYPFFTSEEERISIAGNIYHSENCPPRIG